MKPCPFCSGKATLSKIDGDERNGYATSASCVCGSCNARSRWESGDTSKPGYADNSTVEARAVAAWDARALAPPADWHIVVTGNVIDGLFFFGPFPSYDDALEYVESINDADWHVVELQPPEAT